MQHEDLPTLTTSIQFTSAPEHRQKCSAVISLCSAIISLSYQPGASLNTEIMLGIFRKEFEYR